MMQPPVRRLSKSQLHASRLGEGMSSSYTTPLDQLPKEQLFELRDRTVKMLDNKQLLATLPDKGARLKEKLAQLNALLKPGYTPEDTEKVVDQVSNLSLKDKYRRNMRKKSIDEHSATANQLHHLLQPGSTVPGGMMARSKMISLSESVHLQETLTKQEKELSLKKQMQQIKVTGPEAMDTDDLTSTLGRMQIQGLTHHEYDDDTDTEDEDEHDYEQSYEDDSFHQLDSAYEEGENDDDR